MTREDRAITIVELITQAMAAINKGEQAEQFVCTTLARASHAESAALIGLEIGQKLHIHSSWPDQRQATVLAEAATRGTHRSDNLLRLIRHPALGEVVTIGSPLDSEADRDRARLLALARRGGFGPEAHALFTEVVAPLTLLLPHVADACRRDQSARTASAAAAALNLTAREVEVLQLLSEGLLARTIAARLGLSPRTVHKHLSNVYTKLGVHDRLVAVSIAREQGLISA